MAEITEEHKANMHYNYESAIVRRARALGLMRMSKEDRAEAMAVLKKRGIQVFKNGKIGN